MVWRTTEDQGHRVIPRREGCVLVLYERQWEDEAGLLPVSDPIPVDEWLAETRRAGYQVTWTPEGALAAGPYGGGVVVEVADAHGRSPVAVPREALDRLEEIMEPQDYQLVREDLAALANPEGRGLVVTRLDRAAWENSGAIVPRGDPLPVEAWTRVIRTHGMRVGPPVAVLLPLEGPWPVGRVVPVRAAAGARPSYFAVPRGLARLVEALAAETERRPETDTAPPFSRENEEARGNVEKQKGLMTMIAGSMRVGIVERVPLATFVAHLGNYARQLIEHPEHRLELLLVDHDGTVAQVALATHRFHAYLAVAEQRRRATDLQDAERYNNDALRQAQIVVVEPGDAVVLLDPAPALVLLPPDLYDELRRELLDGLSRMRENDPAFVERIVSAGHDEG